MRVEFTDCETSQTKHIHVSPTDMVHEAAAAVFPFEGGQTVTFGGDVVQYGWSFEDCDADDGARFAVAPLDGQLHPDPNTNHNHNHNPDSHLRWSSIRRQSERATVLAGASYLAGTRCVVRRLREETHPGRRRNGRRRRRHRRRPARPSGTSAEPAHFEGS